MRIEEVSKLKPIDRLVYWIKERHWVYLRKKAGKPKPWTDDKILQSTYFTNPYRENDKVTVWMREKFRDPLKHDPSVIFATIAFRWFNWIPTGNLLHSTGLLRNWNTLTAVQVLARMKERGEQVFTGAFNISNSGSSKPKINRVCEDYIQPVWEDRAKLIEEAKGWTSLQEACARLRRYPGLGGSGFMVAQIVADLKYTDWLAEDKVADWWKWCSPGPGSKKGLTIALGKPIVLKDWHKDIEYLLGVVSVKLESLPRLHAQDLQNCLCEFFKMEHIRNGGRGKRTYPGS